MGNLGPLELTLILVIVVLLFGAKRLPETAKSVGQSLKIFKKTISEDDEKKDAPREVTSNDDVAPPPSTRSDEPNRTEL
ncbi:Sec-independent protein translocase subunit TatA [Sporichthya polymorpha]|uniref:Sec-independent protein translocase subunit TatA n=1 Tax=Sporichthya polymorpha TaxID=35751 RepID=UPI000375D562|nr:Sec-independent protein translocase subunit TatA [Sporichthya polymorpha]